MFQDYALHPTQNTATGFGLLTVGSISMPNVPSMEAPKPRTFISPALRPIRAIRQEMLPEPVTYNNYITNISYRKSGLRLGYQADLGFCNSIFLQCSTRHSAAEFCHKRLKNTVIPQAALQVSYELIPDYTGIIRNSAAFYDYPRPASGGARFQFNGLSRRSWATDGAATYHLWRRLYWLFTPSICDLRIWFKSPLPTLAAGLFGMSPASRRWAFAPSGPLKTSNPSIGVTGAGYLASIASANVDHELLRNLLLNAEASFENDLIRASREQTTCTQSA